MFGQSRLKKGIMTTAAAMLVLVDAQHSAGMQTATAGNGTRMLCGQPVPPPTQLPPADSGPVVYFIGLCFSAQGNVSAVEPQTYLFYIRLQPSRSSQGQWVPYDDSTIDTIRDDFR